MEIRKKKTEEKPEIIFIVLRTIPLNCNLFLFCKKNKNQSKRWNNNVSCLITVNLSNDLVGKAKIIRKE